MKAIILAGGQGRRLAPYTTVFPKPLVPIGHRPILEIIIRQLARCGFKDAIVSTGYLAELIEAYFSTAQSRLPGISISYVKETEPTGTAGSLSLIDGLDETFLVMNGDILTTLDYGKLIQYHKDQGGAVTIALHQRNVQVDFGVIEFDDKTRAIKSYTEKPRHEYMVSMGVYIYEPRVLKYIEPGKYLDFPTLVGRLLDAGERIVGYHSDDYWLDIGRPDDYDRAQGEFERLQHLFLPEG